MLRPERLVRTILEVALTICALGSGLYPAEAIEHPFRGITTITRTESTPRHLTIRVVKIRLREPGIAFKLSPPSGALETVRETTLDFLKREHAQVAINAHFFLPFPSTSSGADLVGLAASNGNVYSAFETPAQSYAIVEHAPAINLDHSNHARVVHWDSRFPDGRHVREKVKIWNAVAGSAQIITNGVKTIPLYSGPQNPGAPLKPGGPRSYDNANSWYDALQARTAIGLSRNNKTLYLVTVDRAGGSLGMRVGEVADLLMRDYGVYNALNLDGGGSTSMAMEKSGTQQPVMVNKPSDPADARAVGSSLAVFARPARVRAP